MKPKIILISEFYYPVDTSTGYYITEIAENIARQNNNVHVICTNSKYHEIDKSVLTKEETHNGVYIHRVITRNIDKNNFILRTLRLLISSFRLFFKLLIFINKDDKILIVTNPAFLILLMPFIKLIKRAKYSILVHDVFPENLIAIGKIKKDALLSKLLSNIFNRAYSNSESCIVLGRDMEEIIRQKVNNKIPIEVITNWADTVSVKPLNKNETSLIQRLKLKEKFVFQFAGNLGAAQGLQNIIEAIKLLDNKNLHFLFIGSGAMETTLREFSKNNYLKNVTIIGFQKKEQQQDFLNACDVAIVTLNEGMYGLGVPSKSYNIMAAGKPILVVADERSEISLTVKENNIGWIVQPNNPEMLADYFNKIYQENSSEYYITGNPRRVAETLFSKEFILNKYNHFFNN